MVGKIFTKKSIHQHKDVDTTKKSSMKQSQRDFFEEEGRPAKKGRLEEAYDFLDEEAGIVPVKEENLPVHRINIRPVTSAVPSSRREVEENSEKIAWYVCWGIMLVLFFVLLCFLMYPVGSDVHPSLLQSNVTPIYDHHPLKGYHQYPMNPYEKK